MSEVFDFSPGNTPLLISVPHDGRQLPPQQQSRMSAAGIQIPDTDWHVAQLYDFATHLGASILTAKYSRYVVDLNRSANDEALYPGQLVTGLCPERTFSGAPIYAQGGVSEQERASRVQQYWRPYHKKISDTLSELRQAHGYAVLWDAHSIPSVVPSLFDGELPALSLGSNDGKSCGQPAEQAVAAIAASSNYSSVVNGRFKGGYITRHYGAPDAGVHALQMELTQRCYMDETSLVFDEAKALSLRDTLQRMLLTYVDAAKP